MHLPHYAVTAADARAVHVLARQPIDLSRPHPFTNAGNTEFNTLAVDAARRRIARATCSSPTRRSSARCSAATRASSASGRTSPPSSDDAGAGRHPERRAATAARRPMRRPTSSSASTIGGRPRADAALRRRRRVGRRSRASAAGDTWVSVALTFAGLEALGVPRGVARQLRLGVPAGHGRPRRRARRQRREQPGALGEAARLARRARRRDGASRPTAARLDAALSRAREAYAAAARRHRHLAAGLPRLAHRDASRSAFATASATRRSRAAACRRHEPARAAARRPASSCSAISTRPAAVPPHAAARRPRAQRDLRRRSASCTSASPRFAGTCASRRASADDEELVAAKMMGRWRSGAPLALCPLHDDPELGADPRRNNDFRYGDDPIGYETPPGSHIRRANPRDASVAGVVRLHRMIRRGTAYGPELPEGVLEDDGVDRGLDVRVRRRAPRTAVRVRAVGVDERRATSWGSATSRIRSSARTTGRHATRSRAGRSRGACRACRGSSSPAAANTASCPGCARCAGSRSCAVSHAGARAVDVVVIGAGPAGVVAALRAGDLGARTTLVTRGDVRRHGGARRAGAGADAGPRRAAAFARRASSGATASPSASRRWTMRAFWPACARSSTRCATHALLGAPARGGGRHRVRARGRGALPRRAHASRPSAVCASRRPDHPLHRRRQPAARRARLRADGDAQRRVVADVGSAVDDGASAPARPACRSRRSSTPSARASQLFQAGPRILPTEDEEVSAAVAAAFRASGIDVHEAFGAIERFERTAAGVRMVFAKDGSAGQRRGRAGRRRGRLDRPTPRRSTSPPPASTTDARGFIRVDAAAAHLRAARLRRRRRDRRRLMLVPQALQAGFVAATNAVARRRRRSPPTSVTPIGSFTDPEYAQVGLTEAERPRERTTSSSRPCASTRPPARSSMGARSASASSSSTARTRTHPRLPRRRRARGRHGRRRRRSRWPGACAWTSWRAFRSRFPRTRACSGAPPRSLPPPESPPAR